jgi:hypothetical protein
MLGIHFYLNFYQELVSPSVYCFWHKATPEHYQMCGWKLKSQLKVQLPDGQFDWNNVYVILIKAVFTLVYFSGKYSG